jgi:hypothetical protein
LHILPINFTLHALTEIEKYEKDLRPIKDIGNLNPIDSGYLHILIPGCLATAVVAVLLANYG